VLELASGTGIATRRLRRALSLELALRGADLDAVADAFEEALVLAAS
jgi:hypothetical protein